MVETKASGRRAAAVELDAISEIAVSNQQSSGRRASRVSEAVKTIEAMPAVHPNYVGRRFEARQRYGIAPTRQMLAVEIADNVVALPNAIDVAQAEEVVAGNVEFIHTVEAQAKPSGRLGFAHKVAAVAAVSGLALAAWTPQISQSDESDIAAQAEAGRMATSSVIDVKAPTTATVDVERAALTSDVNPNIAHEQKLSKIMAASGGDVTAISSTTGLLDRPVNSNRITSPFGFRSNPTGAGTMIHGGTDFGVACGTDVHAAADGIVTLAGWAGHSGNRVMIDHGDGLVTGYSHNTKVLVKVGDKVKRGDLIALSGTTGNSTGCHVHFDVIVNGKFKDPEGWL